ncbi:MAG: hypothetical protein E7256_02990 [Lachnospiraceae bacterium]|nr:hypothetical protein [Lachnospiraceae bacterium]
MRNHVMLKRITAFMLTGVVAVSMCFANTNTQKVSAETMNGKTVDSLTIGTTMKGEIEDGESAPYTFKTKNPGLLTLDIRSRAQSPVKLQVWSADNDELIYEIQADYNEAKGYAQLKTNLYVDSKKYYLRLQCSFVNSEGNYVIYSKFKGIVRDDSFRSNHSFANAIAIPVDAYYEGMLSSFDMEEYYAYTVKNGAGMKFSVESEDTLSITVLNTDNEEIERGYLYAYRDKNYTFEQDLPKGKYIIKIEPGVKDDFAGHFFSIKTGRYVQIDTIGFVESKRSIALGKSEKLTMAITPSTATESYTFTSSNRKVATVSEDGTVKAVGTGTAVITVKTSDGGLKATTTITVPVVKVTKLTLNKSIKTLTEGKTFRLKTTVSPSNATDKTVTYKSSNKAVATVNQNGKVTAKKAGTAVITVTSSNGKKATCKVTVNPKPTPTPTATPTPKPTPKPVSKPATTQTPKPTLSPVPTATPTQNVTTVAVEKITVNATTTLAAGEKKTLSVTVAPANATDKTLTYTSSNPSVVTVKNGVITGVKSGNATIIITSSNGVKAYCTVIVS